MRWIVFLGVALIAVALGYVAAIELGAFGRPELPGSITAARRPAAWDETRDQSQRAASGALGVASDRQVLFGDLHVHTTFSMDAFLRSLPLLQGEGAHPPADACDFARFCSALDFFSLNDHSEGLVPRQWQETKESIRACNAQAASASGGASPDLVAYLGYEWTQMGRTPEDHYGHKNVVFRDLDDAHVPSRPIAASGFAFDAMRQSGAPTSLLTLADFANRERYFTFGEVRRQLRATPVCEPGVDTRELPDDCVETAATPRVLFEKLAQWGYESIVIPHGNAWGNTTARGVSWDKQLANGNHDPQRQRLIELYSGHGNSEEYRPWRSVERDSGGHEICPSPIAGYEPSCWRAGEIIRARCSAAGESEIECEARAVTARANYLAGDERRNAWLSIPGQQPEDWLDAGQCTNCFQPAYNYRPGGSVQYALGLAAPSPRPEGDGASEAPSRFRFGIIASSDNHTARAGSGYKEAAPVGMTDLWGVDAQRAREFLSADAGEPLPHSRPVPTGGIVLPASYAERSASFYYTGGLVGVHAVGRDRSAIWNALKRREVYGTSGPRILLWFDLLNAVDADGQIGSLPMGSETRRGRGRPPRFRVRAIGAFEQKPGCPDHVGERLGRDRLEKLCLGECYHPSDRRYRIDRIEVVRIRPQLHPDEDVATLIDDPWRVLPCDGDPAGCTAEFEDSSFASSARDTLYYVRAIQEPTPQINGGDSLCERDEQGRCNEVALCLAGNSAAPDDCLAADEARAWSSPIFVDFSAEGDRGAPQLEDFSDARELAARR